VAIPDFSAGTEAAIAALLPPFGQPGTNPLDVTGFGVLANLSGEKKGSLTAVGPRARLSRCRTRTWTSCCSPG